MEGSWKESKSGDVLALFVQSLPATNAADANFRPSDPKMVVVPKRLRGKGEKVRAKLVTSLLRLNPCATICEVAWMLRRPLISDGAEVQPLLCGIPGIQSSRRLPDARCCQVAGTTESPAATRFNCCMIPGEENIETAIHVQKEVAYTHDESSVFDVGAMVVVVVEEKGWTCHVKFNIG
ncbi:hypothetical protein B0H13DRAFT_1887981 [Mycena leptocephala]|nr:hypothetical protein B0H13DRAFT_1887981 [Mycena leptocephala]